MDQDRVKDWRELCQAAANELDPKKLMALIAEITRALDERDERRNIASGDQKMASRVFPSVLRLKYPIRRRPVVRVAKLFDAEPLFGSRGFHYGRVTLVLFRTRRRDECSRLKEGVRRRVRKSRQKEAAGAADAGLMQIEWSKRGL